MSTSEFGQPSRDEKRSGVSDRRSAEAPFSDLINRWLAEGDRISEVAHTVAAQPKERPLFELLRDLRAKADRHRFVVVFGAIALSAIAVIAMRAFSHAVLKTDNVVAAEPMRPAPIVIVATAQPAPPAAPSMASAPPAPSADPPAPSADPPAATAAPSAPSADPPAASAAPSAPSTDPPAAANPVAPAADPPASPLPTPAPIAAAPAPAATTAAPAQPESAATASEPEPAPAPAPTVASAPAPAADPPVSEHPPLPVTARPAPAPRRPAPAANTGGKTGKTGETAAVNTRSPLEACQSAIRGEHVHDALISCDKLTRDSPKSADAVVLLAHANLLAGRDAETLKLARRASAIDPKCAEAYLLIGNVEQAAGRVPGARSAYEAYLHAAPRGAHAAEVRAILKTL